jgi:hypothetical protein
MLQTAAVDIVVNRFVSVFLFVEKNIELLVFRLLVFPDLLTHNLLAKEHSMLSRTFLSRLRLVSSSVRVYSSASRTPSTAPHCRAW